MFRKLTALLLAFSLLVPFACALTEEDGGVYALMTIPYELFYEAETTGGSYDSVSSATRVMPLKMDRAGGSFHFMSDGREITGVIWPVRAESEEALAAVGTPVTDDTRVTVTVNEGGKAVTTTYTGRDALFESFPFSYSILSEKPAVYKDLLADSSFGPVRGPVAHVDGTVKIVPDPYAQVCVSVEGVDDALKDLEVNAVVLEAEDGTRVGMKHVENIWLRTLAGFDFDSEAYALLKGKALKSVVFYTVEAVFSVSAGDGARID